MHDMRTEQDQTPTDPEWLHEVLTNLVRSLSALSGLIQDESHRVDEYQVMSLTGDPTNNTIQLQPDFDTYPEIIEAVVVTGPVTTNFTLNLGKRAWFLNTFADGLVLISPLKLSMDRNDIRLLTSAQAGNWSLELMGYADIRNRYK